MPITLTLPSDQESQLLQIVNDFLTRNPIILDNVLQQVLSTAPGVDGITNAVMNRAVNEGTREDIQRKFSEAITFYLNNSEAFAQILDSNVGDIVNNMLENDTDVLDNILREKIGEIIDGPDFSRQMSRSAEEEITRVVEENVSVDDNVVLESVTGRVGEYLTDEVIDEHMEEAIDHLNLNQIAGTHIQNTLTQMDPVQLIRDSIGEVSVSKIEEMFQIKSLEDRFSDALDNWIKQCLPLSFIEEAAAINIGTPSAPQPLPLEQGMGTQPDLAWDQFTVSIPVDQNLTIRKIILALGGKIS